MRQPFEGSAVLAWGEGVLALPRVGSRGAADRGRATDGRGPAADFAGS